MSATPAAGFGFAPDPQRAAALDQAVRAGLADSLHSVFDTLGPAPRRDGMIAALLQRIRAGPVAPSLFGCYFELVLALFDARDAEAAALVEELLRPANRASDSLRIVTLEDRDLGPGQSRRYQRLLRADVGGDIQPLSPERRADAAARLDLALDLLRLAAPDLWAELSGLVREIVLARPGEGPGGFTFGGASSFALWGALVLNAASFGERLDIAVSLAHEAAHTLLFGLALGGSLTQNDPAERYPSPLRQDPRPMEAVAHATFVTARMIYALEALIAAGVLSDGEAMRAREQLAANERACDAGFRTVASGARFTPAGASTFEGLRRYMEGRRAPRVP